LISGGGRCNLLPDTTQDTRQGILPKYPRGSKELHSAYKAYPPSSILDWFNNAGVQTKTEADGRTFPITDDSQTVATALLDAAKNANVAVRTKALVKNITAYDVYPVGRRSVEFNDTKFDVTLKGVTKDSPDTPLTFDALVVATGSSRQGYDLLNKSFNHTIVKPVASLFTLSSTSPVLAGLAGVTIPHATVTMRVPTEFRYSKKAKTISQSGPLLVTHTGLSGPAALKMSAYGARMLAELDYKADLMVDFVTGVFSNANDVEKALAVYRAANMKRHVRSATPDCFEEAGIPKRMWVSLVDCAAGLGAAKTTYAELSKKEITKIAQVLKACPVKMDGKGVFKEEFVTAGGVCLSEVHVATMESRLQKNLFLVGEAVDVDGVTGGYNFLNCWIGGRAAGMEVGAVLSANG
jgi:predicted Rossmann fold flavoprotein